MFRSKFNRSQVVNAIFRLLRDKQDEQQVNIVFSVLIGQNGLGQLVKQNEIVTEQKKYKEIIKILTFCGDNMYQNMVEQLIIQLSSLKYIEYKMKILNKKNLYLMNYLIQYERFMWLSGQTTNQQNFNKQRIDVFCQRHKSSNINNKMSIILKLYDTYIKQNDDKDSKYASYQYIQHLLIISDSQFQSDFNIDESNVKENIVNQIKLREVNSIDELKLWGQVAQHVEYRWIRVNIFEIFNSKDILDNVMVQLLNNIENRLLYVWGSQYFIITREVRNNNIFRSKIDWHNYEQIDQQLCQCIDSQLYDLILVSDYDYEKISNLKIRFLHYYYDKYPDISLTLNYPKYLLTIILYNVSIANISECINLINLCSFGNTYTKSDIITLYNLKRLYSYYDDYDNKDTCLLQDLFQNNQLEYTHIYNSEASNNIIASFTLKKNICNLRYLVIYQQQVKYDICLNISNEFPKNLRVYHIETIGKHNQLDPNDIKYGTIEGPSEDLKRLERNLIHPLKRND